MASKKKTDDKDEDCSCYAESHTKKACPPVQNVTHPLRYYEFTQEEIKTLEECDKESFYRRCLPISTVLAATTFWSIRNGHADRHPHFGAVPKVSVAILVGYMIGRVVYTSHCEEKLRKKLPSNSYLGQVMRKHEKERNPPDPKKKR